MRTETYQRPFDGEWVTHVYVSRRNLLALLAKLDGSPQDSSCTIGAPVGLYPATYVTAEEDDVHYAHESRGEAVGTAGWMHPETEAAILMIEKGDPEWAR